MKIAIFGATGLLGANLIINYKKKGHNVRGFSQSNSQNISDSDNTIINFDYLEQETNLIFTTWKPNIIINTISIVNLQKCEDDYIIAYNINTTIAEKLCLTAKQHKSYYIHISTDHFYNNTKKKHSETDQIDLLNNYAKTKYQAEERISYISDQSLIVRTNIIGFRKNNIDSFFEWLLHSIQKNKQVHLFTNYYTSPISVNQLGSILLECYSNYLTGVYNISSREIINKFNFGIKTAEKFGYSTKNVFPSILENNIQNLQRAINLGLDVTKIENALNIKMPTIDETLTSLHKEYHE